MIYSYNKSQKAALFSQLYFSKEFYMSRTDLQPIIRSLNTVFTETGICHTGGCGLSASEVGMELHPDLASRQLT